MSEHIMPQGSVVSNTVQRPRRTAPFTMVDDATALMWGDKALKLKATAFLVYVAILRHRDRKTGRSWPSAERIMVETGLAKGTVLNAVHSLKAAGLMSIEPRRAENGYDYFVYTVHDDWRGSASEGEARSNSPSSPVQNTSEPGSKHAKPRSNSQQTPVQNLNPIHTSSPRGREDVEDTETAFAPRLPDGSGRDAVGVSEITEAVLRGIWQRVMRAIRYNRDTGDPGQTLWPEDLYGMLAGRHGISEEAARQAVDVLVARDKLKLVRKGSKLGLKAVGGLYAKWEPEPKAEAPSMHDSSLRSPEPALASARNEDPVEKRSRQLEEVRDRIRDEEMLRRLEAGIERLAGMADGSEKFSGIADFWDGLYAEALRHVAA